MIFSFGAFEIDDARYELRRNGEVVPLRRKVFDVLHYLVRHNDRLVSKGELLRSLWPGEMIQDGVIPQNIAILRKLLGDSREQGHVIQTVHGRGYRFVARVSAVERSEPPTRVAGAPFVGRERVMQELRALLADALAGKGGCALLIGEAGIGKTRTADELAAEARLRGARVYVGRCPEGEGAPGYWPWVQLLRAALDAHSDPGQRMAMLGEDSPELARLVGELRGQSGERSRPQPQDSAEARFRLFDGIVSALTRLARAQPLLLILDDLHWADEATLHLLRFVSRELRGSPLLVIGTAREVDPRATGGTALLAELSGATHVQRMYLRGLSQADTSALVTATLQREVDDATLGELHALTEGNPFFVQEIARLIASETAAGRDDRWRLELPGRVREVVGMRLQGLGAAAQRSLALASVIGLEFGLAVLEQVAGQPRAELLGLLEEATSARIVREASEAGAGGGSYRFAHALIRESLYGLLPEPERVRLHEQVGLALEALFGVDADAHLSELAHHFYRAAGGGEVERAVSYCVRAAEQALEVLAFEHAVQHYRCALDALACRLPVDEERRFGLKLALGSAQFRAGADGNSALLGAAEIARRLARPDLLGRVVLAMCGWPRVTRHGRTANRELYPLLAEALAAPLPQAPLLRARLLSALALNCPLTTPAADRVALGREALELARQSRDDEALHDALLSRLQLMLCPEDTARRLGLASELLTVAERLGQRDLIFTAHELRVQPLLALGDVAGADEEIATCARLAAELGLRRCTVQVLRFRMQRALGDGRFDQIEPLTEQAVSARGRAPTSGPAMITMFAWLTFSHAWRGNMRWLARHIESMAPSIDKAAQMRAQVAYLYAMAGRLPEAQACYRELLDRAVLDEGRDDSWLTTLVLTAEAATVCGDAPAAELLYPRLLPYASLNVAHLEMLVYFGCCAHWLGLLATLLGERSAAAEHFETALEMNASLGARPALARNSLAYARLLLGRDRNSAPAPSRAATAQGRALLREATRLAEELGLRGVLREARSLAD